MATTTEAIQAALVHHQAGRLDEAERIYRQVLDADPRHAGALHLWGLVAVQTGDFQTGVARISQAIRLDGGQAAYHANLGEAYRGLGRLDDARRCYQQALRLKPGLPEAQNNLGTILQAQGQLDEAIVHYQAAASAKPGYADAHNNLGTAYQAQGRWEEAIASYRRSVEAAPAYAKGHYNLGNALHLVGSLDEARAALERAITIDPQYALAHYVLGAVLHKQRQWEQARMQYERALQLEPRLAEVHSSLGTLCQSQGRHQEALAHFERSLAIRPDYAEAHYNWGTALVALGKLEEAAAKYRRAIECKPAFADAHYNLGTVMQQLGRPEEAAVAYEEAIRLRPDFMPAHNNLGNVYHALGRADDAVACYRRALAIDAQSDAPGTRDEPAGANPSQGEAASTFRPTVRARSDAAQAYSNLGNVLHYLGEADEALACYRQSLELDPDFPEAHHNLGLFHLSHGRLREAWPEYFWRLKCRDYPVRDFARPLWQGEDLAGRTLLVHAEQGLGDTLQMVRFVPLVQSRGARVVLEVQPPLLPLLASSGYPEAIGGGSPLPPFDLHVPILNLPGVLGTTLETIPRDVPYLKPNAGLAARWRDELSAVSQFKVGISWQGNRTYAFDRERSIDVRHFAPLAALGGVRLFSLQKIDGGAAAAPFTLHDFGPDFDRAAGAFMDTAAVMQQLDLVVTSDTAIAHLAGALGVPVWVALPKAPDWRWFLDREDSPWYPTMRLFRQSTAGDWPAVFDRIAAELERLSRRERLGP